MQHIPPTASLELAPPGASQGMPAVLAHQHALIAQNGTEGSYEVSWIADSGAGRDLASMKAFQEQGIPKQCINGLVQTTQNVRFETGNGCVNSDTAVVANGSKFGEASFHLMQSCPLVRSLGQIVESGKPFVWLPGQLPFFGFDEQAVQLAADSERIHVADKVDDHAPIFSVYPLQRLKQLGRVMLLLNPPVQRSHQLRKQGGMRILKMGIRNQEKGMLDCCKMRSQ